MLLNSLNGVLTEKCAGCAYCLVNGVEWALAMSAQSLGQLPAVGADVRIYTQLKVSENSIALYGFASLEERSLFDSLISVSGVGPKLALGLLSKARAHELALWIVQKDAESLAKLPGLGKKTAEKLALQLSDRLEKQLMVSKGAKNALAESMTNGDQKYRDLLHSLVAMGYAEQRSREVLDELFAGWHESPDEGECLRQAIVLLHGGA